jgi:hypothetical protein
MSDEMRIVKMDLIEMRVTKDEIYFGKCFECGKLLNGDEMAYGHDCESF